MNAETIELTAKLLAVAGSVFALYKVIAEFVFSRKSRLRDEFKFVKEFISDLKPETHPFVVEKGYLAITGDSSLGAREIRYLLSLSSPAIALRKYSQARKYLAFQSKPPDGESHISFAPKYKNARKRSWIKNFNVGLYIFFATLAFAPIVFAREIFGTNWQAALVVISMAFLSFAPLAVTFLAEYAKVLRAKELVVLE